MTSPDVAAAEYTPHWRGRPLPRPGDHITMVALVHTPGSHFMSQRHVSGEVDSARLRGNLGHDMIVMLDGDPTEYTLRQATLVCDWGLQTPASRDPIVPAPIPEQPAAAAVPAESTSIVALERRLLAVRNRLAAISGEEKALKAEAEQLSRDIRDTALEQEMESLPAVDGMTAYFMPAYYVEYRINPGTGEKYTARDVTAALKECGHGYLLGEMYNGNQLRALIREIKIENEQPLPPALDQVLTLGKRYDVQFTPMGDRKRRAAPRRAQ